ncbi:MAG: hypothetical protein COV52_01060 [Gammaproteobacteria bacterium CG11_big_fil_rev_8_21_14_0_20_46_22]|nr:MAG: hypothetical protein COW05_03350 [Gammaproteobacteria bacterium CG12_big_fil_rev_8_21_14_0_65_46_12]PIR12007.1 MAG: hypothetical protein COV52_01060 [Gammaproteobacteria bacterium CG11_big_fil_rev_8_21_14_0_20_46_22]
MARLKDADIYCETVRWLEQLGNDGTININDVRAWLETCRAIDKDSHAILCAGFDELLQTQGHSNPHFSLGFHQDHNPGLSLAGLYYKRFQLSRLARLCLALFIEAGIQGPLTRLKLNQEQAHHVLLPDETRETTLKQAKPHRFAALCFIIVLTAWLSIAALSAVSSPGLNHTLKQLTQQAKIL